MNREDLIGRISGWTLKVKKEKRKTLSTTEIKGAVRDYQLCTGSKERQWTSSDWQAQRESIFLYWLVLCQLGIARVIREEEP